MHYIFEFGPINRQKSDTVVRTERTDGDKFETLNCNSVAAGMNPSCSDACDNVYVYKAILVAHLAMAFALPLTTVMIMVVYSLGR